MKQGYIKLFRTTRKQTFYSKPDYVIIWIELLLTANYKDSKIIYKDKPYIIPAGFTVVSQSALSKKFGISLNKVHRILKYFEQDNMIKLITTNSFTVAELINWKEYQEPGTVKEDKTAGKVKKETFVNGGSTASESENQQKTNRKDNTLNINDLQDTENDNRKQIENKQKASRKPVETSKNIKNIKNKIHIRKNEKILDKDIEILLIYTKGLNVSENDDDFINLLYSWIRTRKEKNQAITKTVAEFQVNKLKRFSNPAESIKQSIERNYSGLFDVKGTAEPGKQIKTKIDYSQNKF